MLGWVRGRRGPLVAGVWLAILAETRSSGATSSARRLPRHTISGLSAGGSMVSTHLLVASASVDGAAINAGSAYGCGELPDFDNSCNYDDPPIDNAVLRQYTANRAADKLIDPLSNLKETRLYLYSGTRDSITYHAVMRKAREYFSHYVDRALIKHVFNYPSEHGYITDGYGECCDCLYGSYVLDCGYDQAGDQFKWLYDGNVTYPSQWHSPSRNMFELDQKKYAPSSRSWVSLQMRATAYAYVPTKCHGDRLDSCRLHVHYHGCGGDGLPPDSHIGMNQWAEANNIVIVYPQANWGLGNLMGCWDWWGVTGKDFDTKNGGQIGTVLRMISDLPGAIRPGGLVASSMNRTRGTSSTMQGTSEMS